MPTRNRPDFVRQSIAYFQRQDYAARELIIVDDGTDDLTPLLPDDERIRYTRTAPCSIGAKRNRACELARGDLIAQWDDDDWYASDRLTIQAEPLLAGEADITGLRARIFFDLERWLFWTCAPQLHHRIFVHDVHGGTLMYRRGLGELATPYPDGSLGEAALLLRRAVGRAPRLRRLPQTNDVFIYVRHGSNSWRFECGRSFSRRDWVPVAEPSLPPEDRAFYATRSGRNAPS